jgi:hypothetical protein
MVSRMITAKPITLLVTEAVPTDVMRLPIELKCVHDTVKHWRYHFMKNIIADRKVLTTLYTWPYITETVVVH